MNDPRFACATPRTAATGKSTRATSASGRAPRARQARPASVSPRSVLHDDDQGDRPARRRTSNTRTSPGCVIVVRMRASRTRRRSRRATSRLRIFSAGVRGCARRRAPQTTPIPPGPRIPLEAVPFPRGDCLPTRAGSIVSSSHTTPLRPMSGHSLAARTPPPLGLELPCPSPSLPILPGQIQRRLRPHRPPRPSHAPPRGRLRRLRAPATSPSSSSSSSTPAPSKRAALFMNTGRISRVSFRRRHRGLWREPRRRRRHYAAKKLRAPRADLRPGDRLLPVKIAAIEEHGAEVVVGGARYAGRPRWPAIATSPRRARSACTPTRGRAPSPAQAPWPSSGDEDQERTLPGRALDTVLVAVGGGGLIAGVAAWWTGRGVKVVGVEGQPGSCCLHAALEAGRPVDVPVELDRRRRPRRQARRRAGLRRRARSRRSRRIGRRRRHPRSPARSMVALLALRR